MSEDNKKVVKDKGEKPEKKKSVDELLDELEKTVEKLDNEDISLEEAFKLYEKGMKLAKTCNSEIDLVEKKIIKIANE